MKMFAFLFMFAGFGLNTSVCYAQKYWLEYAELEIAINKSEVDSVAQHYLSQPSMTLELKATDNKKTELVFSRLNDELLVGGIEKYLGLETLEFFTRLTKREYSEEQLNLIEQVFELKADSNITELSGDNFKAYFINRDHDIDDSVYLISEFPDGGILISGKFDHNEVVSLLTSLRWP